MIFGKKTMFKLFEVKEGKLKILPTANPKYIKGFIISSIVLLLVSGLSGWLKIDEKQLWKIYNAIVQHFGLTQNVPIPQDVEKEIEARIELEVDRAIREYELLTGDDGTVRIPPPRFSEKPVDDSVCYTDECRSLGGEMRLCAPWVDNCPKQ
jgi:hypothetical protein